MTSVRFCQSNKKQKVKSSTKTEHNNILTWACSVILPYTVRATSHSLLPYNYKTQCLLIKDNTCSVQVKCQFVFTLTCY